MGAVGTRGRRKVLEVAVAAVIAAALVTAPAAASDSDASEQQQNKNKHRMAHKPPYGKSVQGGDEMNLIHVDKQAGEIFIGRVFPFPGFVGCQPESLAGWANFKLRHAGRARAQGVVVRFDRAFLDPYSFVNVLVEDDAGRWLGSKTIQGPGADESGRIKVNLRRPERPLTISFGVQLSSACPQVGGVSARFPSVKLTAHP